MNIIVNTPNESGAYPAIQFWPGNTAPDGYCIWPDSLETDTFQQNNGFVTLTVARGMVASYEPNTEARNAWRESLLPAEKTRRIAESKARLSAYLQAHPLQWTDGQSYSITAEKQQQLTSKIMSATLAAQTATPYALTWNATGEECQSWTLENLTALAFAIDARVTALVSYQQAQEVAMRDASTMDELEAIVVDYDSVGKESASA